MTPRTLHATWTGSPSAAITSMAAYRLWAGLSLRSSVARRLIASSVSSSAIRFFALASSALSAVLRPGCRPRSIRS